MQKLSLSLICILPATALASEIILHGGYFPDYTQWEKGYYVTISQVDGKHIEGAYIRSTNQEVKLSAGSHTLKISCAFEIKPKAYAAADKEFTIIFKDTNEYKLSATINAETRGKGYCEPIISEI